MCANSTDRTLDLGGKKTAVSDQECRNCGTVWTAADAPEVCPDCCPHENTEEVPLLGTKCEDCGEQLTGDN